MAPGLALASPPAVVQTGAPGDTPLLSPEAALVASRVAAQSGNYRLALALLQRATPRAGPLAGVLLLERARMALAMGRDPYAHLAELLKPSTPRTLRRQAQDVCLQAVALLPLPQARVWLTRSLPPNLKRQVRGILAKRENDTATMLRLIREKPEDPLAGELASLLQNHPMNPKQLPLVAQALFQTGYWNEAHELLRKVPFTPQEPFALTFLRARTAYRLGFWEEAIAWFDKAAEMTTGTQEKTSCWLFAARAWEQLDKTGCAEELYRRIVTRQPHSLEGWTGLVLLLARQGDGSTALTALERAPFTVQEELASRLCATLVVRSQYRIAHKVAAAFSFRDPRLTTCEGVLAWQQGQHQRAQELWAGVVADPRAGRFREIIGLLLPSVPPNKPVNPTRDLAGLARIAVEDGVLAARKALLAALEQDPRFAATVTEHPPTPPLPAPVVNMLAAGFATEVATLLPHLLPEKTPAELAWTARFLAGSGNFREASRAGEKLWAALGPIPAFLLPDELLASILPEGVRRVTSQAPPASRPLLVAVARQESRFDLQAFSPVGARGLWQLMPHTVAQLAFDDPPPKDDALLALRHLEASSKKLGADPLLLAAAYNAGDPWVALWLGQGGGAHPLFPMAVPYAETRNYVLGVLEGLFLARHLR